MAAKPATLSTPFTSGKIKGMSGGPSTSKAPKKGGGKCPSGKC